MSDPPTDAGRRTLAAGAVVVAVFALLAAISGMWSPLARRPLLDGSGPVPYRWVDPPPELASTNQQPTSGTFHIPILQDGSKPNVVFTSDNQFSLLLAKGALVAAPSDRSITVSIEPRQSPADLTLPDELAPFGNIYVVSATGVPSERTIGEFVRETDAILVYPVTTNLHSSAYELLWSADGTSWTHLKTQQLQLQQEVQAKVPGPGWLLVAGVPTSPAPSPVPSGGGATTASVILLVVAGASLLIGIALLIRARRM